MEDKIKFTVKTTEKFRYEPPKQQGKLKVTIKEVDLFKGLYGIDLNRDQIEFYSDMSKKDISEWDEVLIGILNYNKSMYNEFDSIWKVRNNFKSWREDQELMSIYVYTLKA